MHTQSLARRVFAGFIACSATVGITSRAIAEEADLQLPDAEYVRSVNKRAGHASLGYAVGRHGEGLALGPRLDIPVVDSFYLRTFAYLNAGDLKGKFDPVLSVGVAPMFRSRVFLGTFRIYSGLEVWVGYRPRPHCQNPVDHHDVREEIVESGAFDAMRQVDPETGEITYVVVPKQGAEAAVDRGIQERVDQCERQMDNFGLQLGALTGIEFFAGPSRGYFIEVGGQGGVQGNGDWRDAGLIIRAGSQFYF